MSRYEGSSEMIAIEAAESNKAVFDFSYLTF